MTKEQQTLIARINEMEARDLGKAEVFIPEERFMETVDNEIAPLVSEYVERRLENRKLKMLRDSILPGLMSGQLTC